MNANIVMLGTAVVVPFSAPPPTSALTLQTDRRCFAVAPAPPGVCGCEATCVSHRWTFAYTSAAAFLPGNVLFAHIGNVVALTAGRGLAQPAV